MSPKTPRVRLDELLVDRGLAPTRSKARALVMAGEVVVGDQRVDKPGHKIPADAAVRLKGGGIPYVSRGGLKLAHALDAFGLDPQGLRCLDLGASTGGFTDCLLQRGAAEVVAVDVGYGQLAQKLRDDARVTVMERTNARYLELDHLGGRPVDLVVVDCSFIGLALILPAARRCLGPGGRVVALVKPQFEVGREAVGKGGVVRDAEARQGAVDHVRAEAEALGLTVLGVVASPITGPAGNVEYLLAARLVAPADY